METIHEKNRNGLKREKKSLVIIVVSGFGKVSQKLKKLNGIFAQQVVTQDLEKKDYLKKNIITGKAVLLHTKHIDVGSKSILNEWHTSKQDGMHENAMQKALTLLRNGKNFVEKITGSVQNVKNERSSLKTILSLFRQAVAIISQTFNHFAEIAIVASGSFNIYENPELTN